MGEALIVRRGERVDPAGVAVNLVWSPYVDETVDGYSKGKAYIIAAASYPDTGGSGSLYDSTISLWVCVKGVISCLGGCYYESTGSNTVALQRVFKAVSTLGELTVTDSGKFRYYAADGRGDSTALFIAEL